jgi:hypothetical protein
MLDTTGTTKVSAPLTSMILDSAMATIITEEMLSATNGSSSTGSVVTGLVDGIGSVGSNDDSQTEPMNQDRGGKQHFLFIKYLFWTFLMVRLRSADEPISTAMTLPAGTPLVSADISTQNSTAATFVTEPGLTPAPAAPEIPTSIDLGPVPAAADPALPECPENPSTVTSTPTGENVQKPNFQTNVGKKGTKMRPNSSLTARYAP